MNETTSSPARRWRFPLRFSLRTLLVAVTALAMVLGGWFLPYSEETIAYHSAPDGTPDTARPHSRHVQSWQRQWNGSGILHGTWESYHINSDSPGSQTPWLVQSFRHGRRHGLEVFRDEALTYISHYEDDQQHGASSVVAADGSIVSTTTWWRGQLHGDATHRLPDGRVNQYRFARGRVTHVNGQPIQSPLLDKLARGEVDADSAEDMADINRPLAESIDNWPVGRIVLEVDDKSWDGTPHQPWEAMEVLGNAAIVDKHAAQKWLERPFFPLGIDAASGLVLMSRAAGCQCDYRFGCV